MDSTKNAAAALDDFRVDVKLKLSALWASVMFCYVYGDYFWLYAPGKLRDVLEGNMAPLGPATEGVLLGVSVSMAIPAVMVFLSLALRPKLNRGLNLALGAIYTLFVLATMPGARAFYLFMGGVDVALTALVVWYAWTWPKRGAA